MRFRSSRPGGQDFRRKLRSRIAQGLPLVTPADSAARMWPTASRGDCLKMGIGNDELGIISASPVVVGESYF